MNTLIPIALLLVGGLLTILFRKKQQRAVGAVITAAAFLVFVYSALTSAGPRYINLLFAFVAAVLCVRAVRATGRLENSVSD